MELEFRGGLPATTSCDCADEDAKLSGDLVTALCKTRVLAAAALTNHETGLPAKASPCVLVNGLGRSGPYVELWNRPGRAGPYDTVERDF